MKTIKSIAFLLLVVGLAMGTSSCSKFDLDQVENTFSGNVDVTSGGSTPAGDFTGNGDSGTYSFTYDNTSSRADVRFDITTPTGSVNMMVQDKRGTTVLDHTIMGGAPEDSFSGLTEEGKEGIWKVTITLTNFNGDGSYSINPA